MRRPASGHVVICNGRIKIYKNSKNDSKLATRMAQASGLAGSGIPVPTSTEGGEIEGYLERLDCYCDLMEATDEQKVSLLLCGLSAKQYDTLRGLVAPTLPKELSYPELTEKLTAHYGTLKNTRLERAKFRAVRRNEGESVASFVVRLRNAVRYCGFTGTVLAENLVEQFIMGKNHTVIARKPLEKEGKVKLADAVKLANTVLLLEAKGDSTRSADVSRVHGSTPSPSSIECFRCGKKGHKSDEKSKCKAVNKTCNTCGLTGHFSGAKFCKKKAEGTGARGRGPRGRYSNKNKARERGNQNQITADVQQEDSRYEDLGVTHLFSVNEGNLVGNVNSCETPKCEATIGGKVFPFIIDSGAVANIVSSKVFNQVKNKVVLEKPSRKLFAFGQEQPLNIKGEFKAKVNANNRKTSTVFFVYEGNAPVSNLLSLSTAKELQLLHVNSVAASTNNLSILEADIKEKFPNCFKGIGKLKGIKIKLHVNTNISPVAQPVRRLPFGFRDKVEDLLERLQAEDVIEPVEGVGSKWVSPIVVVPKANNDIRMCIDLRPKTNVEFFMRRTKLSNYVHDKFVVCPD